MLAQLGQDAIKELQQLVAAGVEPRARSTTRLRARRRRRSPAGGQQRGRPRSTRPSARQPMRTTTATMMLARRGASRSGRPPSASPAPPSWRTASSRSRPRCSTSAPQRALTPVLQAVGRGGGRRAPQRAHSVGLPRATASPVLAGSTASRTRRPLRSPRSPLCVRFWGEPEGGEGTPSAHEAEPRPTCCLPPSLFPHAPMRAGKHAGGDSVRQDAGFRELLPLWACVDAQRAAPPAPGVPAVGHAFMHDLQRRIASCKLW